MPVSERIAAWLSPMLDSPAAYLHRMATDPMLLVSTLLTLGVILVNGWTDAPNAIATCVSTRAIGVRRAVGMAAVCNFLGVLVMTAVNHSVAATIYNMADFGDDAHAALIALCAAMAAIVIWATAAWYFGIPTSESHALIAGLSGAAIAIQGDLRGINRAEWRKVLWGILLSTALGFALGFLCARLTALLFRSANRSGTESFFARAQICGGAATAFMHGAQDGQKFMSIGLLGIALAFGMETSGATDFPLWLMIICSAAMSLGTLLGGKRIIKSVAMDMVSLEKYQGVAASISTVITLFVASMTGMPVSTSHCSTASIMGVGASKSFRRVNWGVARRMVWAWVLTFPCCGFIGWALAKLFMML